MPAIDKVFKIYLSHSDINSLSYLNVATEISAYLIDWEKMDGLPKCALFVPAANDYIFSIALHKSYLSKEQIVSIYGEVIRDSNLLIGFGDWTTNNNIENDINFARRNDVPVYIMPEISDISIQALKLAITFIVNRGE